ncbi:hypothetical protein Q6350_14095 [Isoptericola sp. b515]|uniref:DUF3592 domain-containing protein n=1 Tax=Isoptericola sp. b515 TaxID=3064652 RepID=UPI002712B14D|nr:DUF3592 domain-containing protein [Isoptericola sp. b515]MDO8149563.1 hypothetical protein [Isoptericola sp. b515]
MNHAGHHPPPARWQQAFRRVEASSTGHIALVLALMTIFSLVLAGLSVDHVGTRIALAQDGVESRARVVHVEGGRRDLVGAVTVELLHGTGGTVRIAHPPGGKREGSVLDVVYDPDDPARAIAVDEPLVDAEILLVTALDVLALILWFPSGYGVSVLWSRRRRGWWRTDVLGHIARHAQHAPVTRTVIALLVVPLTSPWRRQGSWWPRGSGRALWSCRVFPPTRRSSTPTGRDRSATGSSWTSRGTSGRC